MLPFPRLPVIAASLILLFLPMANAAGPETGPCSLHFKMLDVDGETPLNAVLYSIWKQVDEIPADAGTEIWRFRGDADRLYWTDPETKTYWKRYHGHLQPGSNGGGGPADAVYKVTEMPFGTYRILASNIRNGGLMSLGHVATNYYAISKPITLDEENKDVYLEFPVEKKGGTLEVFLIDADSSEMLAGAGLRDLRGTPLPDYFLYFLSDWRYTQGDGFGGDETVPHRPVIVRFLPAGEYTFLVRHPLVEKYRREMEDLRNLATRKEPKPTEQELQAVKPDWAEPIIEGVGKIYSATIKDGETTRVVVRLRHENLSGDRRQGKFPFELNGVVKDEQGNAIADAMVEIYRPGLFERRNWHDEYRPSLRTWTDTEGKYSFRFNPQTILSTHGQKGGGPMPVINRTEIFTTPEPGVYDLTLRWTTVTNPEYPGATVKQLQVVSFTDAAGKDRSELFAKPGTTPAASPLDYLFRRWTITGTVRDGDGKPIPNDYFYWPLRFHFPDEEKCFLTDSDGNCELTFWPSIRKIDPETGRPTTCGEIVQIYTSNSDSSAFVFLQDTPEDRPRPEELVDRLRDPVTKIAISGEPFRLDFVKKKKSKD